MTTSKRTIPLQFYVSAEEDELIREKMELIGTENRSAYLRKMAIDGQIIMLDLPQIREMVSLLKHIGNNVNQLAKRANANGRIYNEDIADIASAMNLIRESENKILRALAHIP